MCGRQHRPMWPTTRGSPRSTCGRVERDGTEWTCARERRGAKLCRTAGSTRELPATYPRGFGLCPRIFPHVRPPAGCAPFCDASSAMDATIRRTARNSPRHVCNWGAQ